MEGTHYYIGPDGKAYYLNNLLSASGKETNLVMSNPNPQSGGLENSWNSLFNRSLFDSKHPNGSSPLDVMLREVIEKNGGSIVSYDNNTGVAIAKMGTKEVPFAGKIFNSKMLVSSADIAAAFPKGCDVFSWVDSVWYNTNPLSSLRAKRSNPEKLEFIVKP